MTKTQKIAAISMAAVIGLAGYTAIVINSTKSGIETEMQAKENLKNDTLMYLTEEHSKEEIEATLINAFKQLDKESNTEIVDALIYGTYNAAASIMMTDEETDALYRVMDNNNQFDISQIEDEELRNGIQNLIDQHIIPIFVNGNMFYDVDYGYFANTFKEYLNDDYYELLHFYDIEKMNDYVDAENSTLLTNVVIERLEMLSDMGEKYADSELLPIMEQCYRFYESIYLGVYSQDYIFTDDAKLKEDIYNSYKEYSEVCENTQLKEFLNTIIKEYEDVDLTRTVSIMEMIREYCEINAQAPTTATPSDIDLTELTGVTAEELESIETEMESNAENGVARTDE